MTICITEKLCCTPEKNTTLQINYIPIYNKIFLKRSKKFECKHVCSMHVYVYIHTYKHIHTHICMYTIKYIYIYSGPDDSADLLLRELKPYKFSFCSLFSNLDMWRGAQENMAWGSELETQHAKSIVLDRRCDLCDREHLSQQEAGGWGRVSCGTTIKTLGGNAKGDDIKKKNKNRPNDLHVPWPVSKHSVVRFSHHRVLFLQHDKVRTLGGANDSSGKSPNS